MATDAPPTFEEHIGIGIIGPGSLYGDAKRFDENVVKKIQEVSESLEGVLAAHVNDVTDQETGLRAYVHHFRAVDNDGRGRAHLQAHAINATFLLEVCEKARDTHATITDSLAQKQGDGPKHHERHALHKLSSHRLNSDFSLTAHADFVGQPSGSHAAKFPAVRVGLRKVKEGSAPEIVDEYTQEVRSLPTRFPLLKQVNIGRNIAAKFLSDHHYPETGIVDWDLAYIFGYASSHDREKLDSVPEFKEIVEKWDSLFGDSEVWDLTVDRSSK